MTLTNPAALWFLTLVVPVLALHVLRSRRTEVTVSSTYGWEAHDRPVAAARPWQRLRWSVPLLLQLLVVALLALALAGPALDTGEVTAQHLVVMVDTSASMGAVDGEPNRLADARRAVLDEVGSLGVGARVSIIATGAPAAVVAAVRAEAGSLGLVSTVSGLLTKPRLAVWSTDPGDADPLFADLADDAAAATQVLDVTGEHDGRGRVVTYTVTYDGSSPASAFVIAELEDGRRWVGTSTDAGLLERGVAGPELVGAGVQVTGSTCRLG